MIPSCRGTPTHATLVGHLQPTFNQSSFNQSSMVRYHQAISSTAIFSDVRLVSSISLQHLICSADTCAWDM
jgi:hypothetical protein